MNLVVPEEHHTPLRGAEQGQPCNMVFVLTTLKITIMELEVWLSGRALAKCEALGSVHNITEKIDNYTQARTIVNLIQKKRDMVS